MKIWRWIKSIFRKTEQQRPIYRPVVITEPDYPFEWLEYALEKVTGTFEGRGYDQVTGNFDGQGLSAGILQWNYFQTSLQSRILMPAKLKYGEEIFHEHFGLALGHMVFQSAGFTNHQGKDFAVRNWDNGFKKRWESFMADERIIEIQKDAAQEVGDKAWRYCKQWGLDSWRAFCFFFDVVTQNGSMNGMDRPNEIREFKGAIRADGGINTNTWLNIEPTFEQELLWETIRRRVKRNRWASDVLARKGTIIFGKGRVHNAWREFDFE